MKEDLRLRDLDYIIYPFQKVDVFRRKSKIDDSDPAHNFELLCSNLWHRCVVDRNLKVLDISACVYDADAVIGIEVE